MDSGLTAGAWLADCSILLDGAKDGGLASLCSPTGWGAALKRKGRTYVTPPAAADPPYAPGAKYPQPGEQAKRRSPTTFSPIYTLGRISSPLAKSIHCGYNSLHKLINGKRAFVELRRLFLFWRCYRSCIAERDRPMDLVSMGTVNA